MRPPGPLGNPDTGRLKQVSGAAICIAALVFACVTAATGVWRPADARLEDIRFGLASRPASGEIVFVDIDAPSLAQIGVWPWPRDIHAEVIDTLLDMGAFEVVLDIDFSAVSPNDARLADALARAGGYVYLAAFQQLTPTGEHLVNRPAPSLDAPSVLVNVELDALGRAIAVPPRLHGIPTLAATLAGTSADQSITIDYSIDLETIDRVSVIDLLSRTVDPARIRDRQVVVGASAIELRDFFTVPRFGVVPGPIIQIAAAETAKQSRALSTTGPLPALVLAALSGLAGLIVIGRDRWPRLLGWSVIVGGTIEIAAFFALRESAVILPTMSAHVFLIAFSLGLLALEWARQKRLAHQRKARLEHLATFDQATGAFTLPAFIERLELAPQGRSVLVLELEGFRDIEANLGPDLAQAAIRIALDRTQGALPGAMIARMDSNRLAIAPRGPTTQAQTDALTAMLSAPYLVDENLMALTPRWGMSGPSMLSGQTAINQAQVALSEARLTETKGEYFATQMSLKLARRQSINVALKSAVARNELEVVFQPQVDLRSGQPIGVEALVRWRSAELGPVSPGEFVPIAEDNGTIAEIGAWVLAESCRQVLASGWNGRLSVNLSPAQFAVCNVEAMVASALSQTGFDPAQLDIEVTESVFAKDRSTAEAMLGKLRDLGIKIAVDDFGSGYSSLAQLVDLPVDKVKLDQSFLRNGNRQRAFQIIKAMADMSKNLELAVIVEGIELRSDVEALIEAGCTLGQGYLFGRPGPLALVTGKDAVRLPTKSSGADQTTPLLRTGS
jgi:predicted signal transduction protein with EAL and GGDEF domain